MYRKTRVLDLFYVYTVNFYHKLTWEEDSFWARSAKKLHKPIGNSRECIGFLVCVEEDESQLMDLDVLPFILNFQKFYFLGSFLFVFVWRVKTFFTLKKIENPHHLSSFK